MKWFKDVRVIIAVLTLVIAGAALGVAIWDHLWASHKYDEITEPHTRFDEIRDKLIMLDNRLSERETWIERAEDWGEDWTEHRARLQQAQQLWAQAELAWVNDDFDEAERLINEAYDVSEEIPSFYVAHGPGPLWVLGVGVVIAIVVIFVVVRRHRDRQMLEELGLSEDEK